MEISKAALVPRTVSSNRSFSYAIFKRRIHDALTTILFQEFFHFLFIYSSSFLYIYIYIYVRRRAKAIYYHQYGPSDIFFFLFFIIFFFFFHLSRIETSLPSSNRSARFDWLVGLAHFFPRRLAFDPCFTDFIK